MKIIIFALAIISIFGIQGASADLWQSYSNANGLTLNPFESWGLPETFTLNSNVFTIVSSNPERTFKGFKWNGTGWESNASIVSGLPAGLTDMSAEVFLKDSVYYAIIGDNNNNFYEGRQWNGAAWVVNNTIVSGLTCTNFDCRAAVFFKDGKWNAVSSGYGSTFTGFDFNGVWNSNTSLVTGLSTNQNIPSPDIFNYNSNWYMISGRGADTTGDPFDGFRLTGSGWVSDANIISGLIDVSEMANPTYYTIGSNSFLIFGNHDGGATPIFTGFKIVVDFDPSGYVFDTAGNPVFNAKVQLSNATFNATPAYSNANGFWNTNIFASGTYNVVVSKSGFVTQSTSQAFTVGGVNNNFTLTPSQGLVFGRIFTTINSTGSTPVKGNLDQIKGQLSDKTVFSGSTMTLLNSPDGSTYVIKLLDTDSAAQTAIIQVLKDGSVIADNVLLQLDQLYQLKIRETTFSTTYIEVTLNDVFQGTELGTININAGFNSYEKSGTSLLQFLGDLVFGLGGLLLNPFNWDGFSTDGSNTAAVTFNASASQDAIGSMVFDAGSSGNIFNFYAVLNAESTSSNAGKVLLGYTDDDILNAPAFTDTLFINSRNIYRGTTEDFKSLDADSDGKIRVWFDFVSGYSSFNLYEFYVNMLGATTLKPLIGANVYFNVTVNTKSTSPNGNYSLFVPFGTDTINYYLTGYESKNITYTFNSTNENLLQDIILNATNRTFNSTSEYVYVSPNPSLTTDQLHAFFRTLDHTNPLLLGSGDYQIAVCPLVNPGDCTKYDVDANTESSISIANPGLGEYTISLTGYLGGFLDFERDIIVSNNFTVLSSTPTIKWDSPIHYLDEAMILSIYVPSGSAFVNVTYPNGTMLYSNSFSTATTLYNVSFQTNSNLSINTFPPGTYKAVITGGNTDFTELKNISAGSYSVSAPSNVIQGDIFTISYQSPRTSTLYITDSNNDVLLSEDVPPQGGTTGTEQFDTATLENKDTILTIQLLRGGVSVANTTVSVTHSAGAGTPGSGGEAAQAMGDNLTRFMAMPAFWGLILFIIGVFAVSSNDRESKRNDTGLVAFILANLLAVIGLWAPFTFYVLVIVWIIAGMNFYVGRKMSNPE